MKINTKKSNTTRNLIISLCAAIVLVIAYLPYAHSDNLWPFSQPHTEEVSTSERQDAIGSSEQASDQPTTATPPTINKTPIQNEPTENTPQPGALQASITVANQNDSTLQIRTLIKEVTTTGACTLTLTSAGRDTVRETVGIHALANSSTCKGFDVDVSKLSAGPWKASIAISIGDNRVELIKNITVN